MGKQNMRELPRTHDGYIDLNELLDDRHPVMKCEEDMLTVDRHQIGELDGDMSKIRSRVVTCKIGGRDDKAKITSEYFSIKPEDNEEIVLVDEDERYGEEFLR